MIYLLKVDQDTLDTIGDGLERLPQERSKQPIAVLLPQVRAQQRFAVAHAQRQARMTTAPRGPQNP
jgi:hypothetical protein